MLNNKDKMILSTLEDIQTSIELIIQRCESIKTSDDFLDDNDGLLKLDSISMRLIAIGEVYNVPICQDHLTQHSYFTHYATSSNS